MITLKILAKHLSQLVPCCFVVIDTLTDTITLLVEVGGPTVSVQAPPPILIKVVVNV